jgi:hypothetical protein
MAVAAISASVARAQVTVSHTQGAIHGFLMVRTTDGEAIGDGDLTQVAHGNRVTTHMVLRFKDGSLQDETTVYSQRSRFLMLSDHVIQKGPSFKHPIDMTVDRSSGQVTVNYADDDGKPQTATERMKLMPDLANGMVPLILTNVEPSLPKIEASMVVATPKPRLVKLVITPEGEDTFLVGASSRKATRYDVKIVLGGVTGVVAPIVGKQPPDTHVWIFRGDAPVFVKSEGAMYEGGPVWRIELGSPAWPQTTAGVTAAPAAKDSK